MSEWSERVEKILLAGFIIFLVVGSIWFLESVKDNIRMPSFRYYAEKYNLTDIEEEMQLVQQQLFEAQRKLNNITKQFIDAEREYLFLREEYRVSLEEGVTNETLKQAYLKAKQKYESLLLKKKALEGVVEQYNSKLDKLREEHDRIYSLAYNEYKSELNKYRVKVFGLRFGISVPLFIASLFVTRKSKGKRWEAHANGFLAYTILLLAYSIVVFAWNTGQVIGLSIIGALGTGVTLYWVRKEYYSEDKVRLRRTLRNECPYCGSKLIENSEYCGVCGRKITTNCPNCGRTIRVNLKYCPYCGTPL